MATYLAGDFMRVGGIEYMILEAFGIETAGKKTSVIALIALKTGAYFYGMDWQRLLGLPLQLNFKKLGG